VAAVALETVFLCSRKRQFAKAKLQQWQRLCGSACHTAREARFMNMKRKHSTKPQQHRKASTNNTMATVLQVAAAALPVTVSEF